MKEIKIPMGKRTITVVAGEESWKLWQEMMEKEADEFFKAAKGESMKTVYYAHFMGIYNTPQEDRDVQTLMRLGFIVVNPNTQGVDSNFKGLIAKGMDYMQAFETVFLSMVEKCDVFAFRGLPDGSIPGGVAMELRHAEKKCIPIIELPCGTGRRSLDGEETREWLRDIGHR